jgi:hypothetical protein
MSNEVSLVNDTQSLPLSKEIVSAIVSDKELRSLKPGSPEYKTAFDKKFSNKNDTSTSSESVTEGSNDKPQTKEASETRTEVSNEEDSEARKVLSKNAQKRFDKLVAERETTKSENAKLAARIAELEAAGKAKVETPKQETKASSSEGFDKPKPKIDDFGTMADYQEALADWKYDQREFQKELTAKAKTAQESKTKTVGTFQEKGKELEKELGLDEGDFNIVTNDEDFKLFDPSRDAIFESEFGPQIAYEIASNDETKEKFSKMSAVQQVAYIGKLEGKFEAKKQAAQETKTISSAKAPGKPLQRGTTVPTAGLSFKPGMNIRDFEAQRKEQRLAKGKKR